MTENIIDTLSSDLMRLGTEPGMAFNNPKLYSSNKIFLEPYAKAHKLTEESLKTLVKKNPFFKLSTTTIQTGLFTKRDKKIYAIEWEKSDVLEKVYRENPDKVIKAAASSPILLKKMIPIMTGTRAAEVFGPRAALKKVSARLEYAYPVENRNTLYKKYLPDELTKYQREGKHESDLEKKFRKNVPKGEEFHFCNGKVVHNLQTWVQCLQLSTNEEIVFHIRNDEFYRWLDATVKLPELARICLMLGKDLNNFGLDEKEVKTELLRRINKTSLNNLIFDILISPLIRTLRSNDQAKAQESIDRLIGINDPRVVEPLIEKIFDSNSQIRRKIISGLGKLGDKRATPTILKVLKHSTDPQDRLAAVKTLGSLNDKRALPMLRKIANDTDEVGQEGARILEQMNKKIAR